MSHNTNETFHDLIKMDAGRLGLLHDRLYPEVYRFAYYRLHDEHLSQQVADEALTSMLHQAAHEPASNRQLLGWLMSCSSRLVNERLLPSPTRTDSIEGVTVVPAPQEEVVIDAVAQQASRRTFLSQAGKKSRRRMAQPKIDRRYWQAVPGLILTLLLLAGLAALIGSTWALPGDSLYPVKRYLEQARLLLAGGFSQRLEIEQAHDQMRLQEVNQRRERGWTGPITLVGGLSQITPDEWLVADVPVIIPMQSRLLGEIEPGWYLEVQGNLQPDGSLLASQVRLREYSLEGKLQRIQAGLWLVDGVPIQLPASAVIRGVPQPGDRVRLRLLRSLDQSLAVRWAEILPVP